MTWTSISKPSTSNYTLVSPQGRERYDQSSISYDDSNVFYDGINPSQWTDVSKPSLTTTTILPGMATGLIAPPTYSTQHVITGADSWIRIDKPI